MVRLQVLGGVSLDVPEGRDAMAVLSHPKRLAVLTYLALEAPGGFLSRDRLLAMFWPEAMETQGRNALNQVLHALRSSLGDGAIVTRGRAEVGVGMESVTCDAVAFLEAVRAGRAETALELYTGHLLQGFHLAGASEFDTWLSEERARLREAAAGVAWTVAHGYLQAGCLVDAERTAQRAMNLVCTDESEVRRFIEALAVAGDRAGAIQFFERFRSLLDRELELEPGPRTEELVQRIRDDPALLLANEGPPEIDPAIPVTKAVQNVAEGDRGEGSNTPRRGFGWRLLTWAMACLAGGWASSQAATLMVARFGWPEPVGQVASLLLVMAAFGFFFALILAFYFGEKARGQATGAELLVVAVVMLAIGGVLSRVGPTEALREWVKAVAPPASSAIEASVTLVVLPWHLSQEAHLEASALQDARREAMARLSRDGRFQVLEWENVSPGEDPPSGVERIAAVVDAEYVLAVNVRRIGELLRFDVQLLVPGDEEPVWRGEVERPEGLVRDPGLGAEIAESLLVGFETRSPDRGALAPHGPAGGGIKNPCARVQSV